MLTKFWSENPKGRGRSEDLGVDWRIIRMDLKEIWWKSVEWIHLVQDNKPSGSIND